MRKSKKCIEWEELSDGAITDKAFDFYTRLSGTIWRGCTAGEYLILALSLKTPAHYRRHLTAALDSCVHLNESTASFTPIFKITFLSKMSEDINKILEGVLS